MALLCFSKSLSAFVASNLGRLSLGVVNRLKHSHARVTALDLDVTSGGLLLDLNSSNRCLNVLLSAI